MPNPRPIALTTGEPAGVGPDLCVRLAQHRLPAPVVAVGDPQLLRERARALGLPLTLEELGDERPAAHTPGVLHILPVKLRVPAQCGILNTGNAPYVLETLEQACRGCIDRRFGAMVTAPVHKGVINEAGLPFTGHTEFLAKLTGAPQPVMMLATPTLRVALATTHVPLSAVSSLITPTLLERVMRTLASELQARFGLTRPRIAVCGLNPHAGEGGHLGREEIDVIEPVVAALRREGFDLRGPLPADTAFTREALALTDAVLAMYHDQGLPVLKHQGFGAAVNITLGLPIIRTSVDHGTALELAGTGKARENSLLAALRTAAEMAEQPHQRTAHPSVPSPVA